jgi:hypothetical protein
VIVNLAGWLYMVQAGLSLVGLLFQLRAVALLGISYFAGSLLISAFVGVIGFGLVNRRSWGHWLALGPSLVAGTLGLLFMILLLGTALFVFPGVSGIGEAFSSGNGVVTAIAIVLMFLVLTGLFSCIVNLKLFLHLIKDSAHEEFGVDSEQKGSRIGTSIATWLVVVILGGFMTGGGSMASSALALMSARASQGDRDAEAQALELERLEARAALEREERRKHEALLEDARKAMEQAQAGETQPAEAAPEAYATDPVPDVSESAPPDSEAPAPTLGVVAEEEESDSNSNKILKCRDKAGAVSYTQGYCPPGTTLVDSPRYE